MRASGHMAHSSCGRIGSCCKPSPAVERVALAFAAVVILGGAIQPVRYSPDYNERRYWLPLLVSRGEKYALFQYAVVPAE